MQGKIVSMVVLSFFLIAFLISGCSIRMGSLTAISTKNVNLDTVDLDKMPQVKGVKGIDSVFIILGIPLGFPTLQGAVDNALEQGSGDLLLDPVFQAEWWSLWLIGQQSITVKGNVVNSKGAIK